MSKHALNQAKLREEIFFCHSTHQLTSSAANVYFSGSLAVSPAAPVATVAARSHLQIIFMAEELHYK